MYQSSNRPRRSLDGAWQFQRRDAPEWRTVYVPAPWQSQGADLRTYQGVATYTRTFDLPIEWRDRAVILHFGAVDYLTEVSVNGTTVGTHEGGYLPFEFDISDAVSYGALNHLHVRVTDPDDDRARWPDTPFAEIPHGKQSWYGPLSGIWQSVYLEARATTHIESIQTTPLGLDGDLDVRVCLNARASSGAQLAIRVHAPDGSTVVEEHRAVEGDACTVRVRVERPRRWELADPALYRLSATLVAGDQVDTLGTRFGFRTIETRDGSLWLNGNPLMLRGALDQDYYPVLTSTPPSYDFLLQQAQLARAMGLNCLRCHIKIPDPRYLDAADEAGLLIWVDLPNWAHWTPTAAERGLATLRGALARDWNHPSLVMLSIINESWGIDLVGNSEHRRWLADAYTTLKSEATGRLVVDNSACFPNFHVQSDIDDFHFYAAMPDERARWVEWVNQFARRPVWSYGVESCALPEGVRSQGDRWEPGGAGYGAPLSEVMRRGDEPLIVSEFGNWGLPSIDGLRDPDGREPWWFETGSEFGDGVVYPHGVLERFARLGLARRFGDYERFAAATRRAELDALTFEIESIRRNPSISGYVITEFTDVHWECNGLLDMQRNPKMPLHALAALNAETVLIPDRRQHAAWCGERISIETVISHWGAELLHPASLRLIVDGAIVDSTRTDAVAPRGVCVNPALAFHTPECHAPRTIQIRIELYDESRLIAAADLPFTVYPRSVSSTVFSVRGATELRAALSGAGYCVRDDVSDIVLTDRYDAELHRAVLAGAHVVVLAERADAFAATPEHALGGVHTVARKDTFWQGSWASSFCWLHDDGPGDGVLDASFLPVFPERVIVGFPHASFAHDISAGLAVGWIQRPVALIGTMRRGRGRVTISTFRLLDQIGREPVASRIIDRLLRTLP